MNTITTDATIKDSIKFLKPCHKINEVYMHDWDLWELASSFDVGRYSITRIVTFNEECSKENSVFSDTPWWDNLYDIYLPIWTDDSNIWDRKILICKKGEAIPPVDQKVVLPIVVNFA